MTVDGTEFVNGSLTVEVDRGTEDTDIDTEDTGDTDIATGLGTVLSVTRCGGEGTTEWDSEGSRTRSAGTV